MGVIGLGRLEGAALIPMLMVVAAAFCWGVGNTITKQAGKIDMLGFVVWSSLVPPLPLLALSLLLEGPGAIPSAVAHITWLGVGALLFMSWCATLFGYGAWSMLLSRYPAGLVAPFGLLIPVSGIGGAALLLGETISGLEIAGSLLVFAGLLLNVFGPRIFASRRLSSS
jgi:O-acetylserine/cysteine efflux transporter